MGLQKEVKSLAPMDNWFVPLIRLDYRLAVLFTVLTPLVLLLWAFAAKADALKLLLGIYWKVASLLAITTYLMIASIPVSFIAALGARILIPISLWYWIDLNEEIEEQPQRLLGFVFKTWRWSGTSYSGIGLVAQIISLPCAFQSSEALSGVASCRAWLEPTWLYREYFHGNTNPSFLGFFGILGLALYVIYFIYFAITKLPRNGRLALR